MNFNVPLLKKNNDRLAGTLVSKSMALEGRRDKKDKLLADSVSVRLRYENAIRPRLGRFSGFSPLAAGGRN